MLILAFKLFLTPLLIVSVTLAGRRWGTAVSGLLIGLPLVSAPISFIIALEHGTLFASRAAIGNLVGEISSVLFCLVYILLAPRFSWRICSLSAVGTFFLATAILNCFSWQLCRASASKSVLSRSARCCSSPIRYHSGDTSHHAGIYRPGSLPPPC